jgi:flagellar biogenesis protein FliO
MKLKSLLIGVGLALAIYMILPFRFLARGVDGSGNVVKENREVQAFHGIEAGSAFRIEVVKGDKQSVVIETDDNIQELIKLKVDDGVLEIETKGNIRNPEKLNAYIVMPVLDDLDLSGACNLISKDRFESDKMDIDLSGASGLKINIKVDNLDLEQSGASKATISGFADHMEIDASGASHSYLKDLEVNKAEIDASGASKINVNVMEYLNGECSGASHINYSGDVKKVDVSTSGAGSVNRK